MKAPRIYRRPAGGGPERVILAAALLVPLGVVILALTWLPEMGLASPPLMVSTADQAVGIAPQRPVSSDAAPPPTLEAPTATPKPAPANDSAVSFAATATPSSGHTYVVQAGDELKHIAADHNVSISKIIAINAIPNPDNLTIGQELRIPSN